MISRRQFISYTAGVLTAVAIAELPKFGRYSLDSKLRMSDLREIFMYSIERDMEHVRYDLKFIMNAKGKYRQFSIDGVLYEFDQRSKIEQLKSVREMALDRMQIEFDRNKRIRANILQLQMPRIDTRPDWAKLAA